jgi:hypothetical protein
MLQQVLVMQLPQKVMPLPQKVMQPLQQVMQLLRKVMRLLQKVMLQQVLPQQPLPLMLLMMFI